jgi:hypothetical protein
MLGLAGLCSRIHPRQEELRASAGRPLLAQPPRAAAHQDWTTEGVSPGAGVSSPRTDVAPRVWHAGQQQDAADEVRAPRWRPSPLILLLGGQSGAVTLEGE